MIPAGTAPGTYWVIAAADWNGTVAESTENNNSRASSLRVGPDLTVPVLTAPSSAVAGTSISVSDTTTNQGGDTAEASMTSFYLSTNLTLDANESDLHRGRAVIVSLPVDSRRLPRSEPAPGQGRQPRLNFGELHRLRAVQL